MELHYGTIKPKDRRQYRAERRMDGRDQIFHILNPADLLISVSAWSGGSGPRPEYFPLCGLLCPK